MSWTLNKKLDIFAVSKKLDTLAGPGEIKRREVCWTLTKKLDSFALSKKLDTFAGSGEIKRREVVLDPQVSPEQVMSREVKLGSESWTSFASVVTQHQCYGHCPCDSPPHSSRTAAA